MAGAKPIEVRDFQEHKNLASQILGGQVAVARGLLPNLDLLDDFAEGTLNGIRKVKGDAVAANIRQAGFERFHEFVEAADLPAVTDAVYREMEALAPKALKRLVPALFHTGGAFYFESSPNVRFHIPFGLAAAHKKQFDEFALQHGQGKIAPHGPHRDSWLDCPANTINLWIAIGRVRHGNGLTIFADDYGRDLPFKPNGEIGGTARLSPPLNFDLAAGDALLFHGDQVHASELNRIDETRYVVSFRVTFGKPIFNDGHYHHYVHSALAGSALDALSGVPANLQTSYVRSLVQRAYRKVAGIEYNKAAIKIRNEPAAGAADETKLALDDLPPGTIKPVSKGVCVARMDSGEIKAFGRYCPHSGADLSNGWIRGGKLVCPWHNLPFDTETRHSPCEAIRPLAGYECRVEAGQILVGPRILAERADESDKMEERV